MKKIKKYGGFTLTELIITVSMIIILATISVPIYKDHVYKAKLAEGYALLGAIREAQEFYYSEWNTFYDHRVWTNNDEVLGVDARGNKYFTYFYPGSGYWGHSNCKVSFYCIVQGATSITMQYNLSLGYEVVDQVSLAWVK